MKKAGFLLGLIGGILAFIFTIIMIFTGLAKLAYGFVLNEFDGMGEPMIDMMDDFEDIDSFEDFEDWDMEGFEDWDLEDWDLEDQELDLQIFEDQIAKQITGMWISIILSFLLSIFAIVGAAICKAKPKLGGIFMLIAGIGVFICSIFAWGVAFMWIATVLLLLGGIFALIPGKDAPPPLSAAAADVPPPAAPTAQTDEKQTNNASKFCSKCGAQIPKNAEFCASCGAKQ